MRLSTKGRYALEALVMLGYMNGENNNVSIKTISLETNISEKYLEQLFTLLKKSSIVVSKKGKNGGYHLTRPSKDITVGDIFRAVEGSLTPVKCLDNEYCKRTNECISRNLWSRIYEKINDVIDNISLEDLICQYKNTINGESI
jgi:Rrf2 family protein